MGATVLKVDFLDRGGREVEKKRLFAVAASLGDVLERSLADGFPYRLAARLALKESAINILSLLGHVADDIYSFQRFAWLRYYFTDAGNRSGEVEGNTGPF